MLREELVYENRKVCRKQDGHLLLVFAFYIYIF